jgi:hypothetical protein
MEQIKKAAVTGKEGVQELAGDAITATQNAGHKAAEKTGEAYEATKGAVQDGAKKAQGAAQGAFHGGVEGAKDTGTG